MSKEKFYQSEEFLELNKEWYDKLKKDGFEDIEWFNPKTGIGQGSPFLRSKSSPDLGTLRARYSSALSQHYRLCRNFAAHGPFYTKIKHIYSNSKDLQRSFPRFRQYFLSLDKAYSPAEEELWNMYADGCTIREISRELRRLHKLKKLGKSPKRWGKAYKGQPYSIFWVQQRLKALKVDCAIFNQTHPEGIKLGQDDEESLPGCPSSEEGSI